MGSVIFNFWFKSAYRNEHLTPRHWYLPIFWRDIMSGNVNVRCVGFALMTPNFTVYRNAKQVTNSSLQRCVYAL
jgi:hypothetical protein